MKSKIYEFNPVIYPFPLLVTKKFDAKELKDRFYRLVNDYECTDCTENTFAPGKSVTARCLQLCEKETDQIYYMVLIAKPNIVRYGVVTHESIHIANIYLQFLGLSSAESWEDEAYAYFGQWVANCMWSVLNNDPELMNGKLFE